MLEPARQHALRSAALLRQRDAHKPGDLVAGAVGGVCICEFVYLVVCVGCALVYLCIGVLGCVGGVCIWSFVYLCILLCGG